MFVSRAGAKLDHALAAFDLDVGGLTCADLGSNTGGFVDCLLHRGAAKVYAIDAGHGTLEWKLRKDARVVVMERTNAMHVELPEPVAFISIDVAWTKQKHILPAARRMLGGRDGMAIGGEVVSLIKPHYEADKSLLRKGILPPERVAEVFRAVCVDIEKAGFEIIAVTRSPITGGGGNQELLTWLKPG